jgi:Na+-transporting methylmalonyl-CoA/oxaloacetate decarboxylase gamma subunit
MLLALTPLQKLSTGSVTFLIGMIITFVVLAVLIGIIYLVNYLINRVDFKKIFSKKNSAKKIDDVTEPSSDSVAENIVVEEKINSAKEERLTRRKGISRKSRRRSAHALQSHFVEKSR